MSVIGQQVYIFMDRDQESYETITSILLVRYVQQYKFVPLYAYLSYSKYSIS